MLVLVQFLLVSPAYRHFLCHLQLLQWGFGCHLWTSSFSWDSAFMVRDADSSVDIQVWTIWASTDTILCLVGFSSSFFVGSGLLKVYHTILRSEPSNISSSSQPPSPRRHQNMQQKKKTWFEAMNVMFRSFHSMQMCCETSDLKSTMKSIMSPAGVNFISVLVTDFLKMQKKYIKM